MANWKNGLKATTLGISLLAGLSGCGGKKNESVLSQQSEAEAAYSKTNWIHHTYEQCVNYVHRDYLSRSGEDETRRRGIYGTGIGVCEMGENEKYSYEQNSQNVTAGTEHATRLYACIRVAWDRCQAGELTEDQAYDRSLQCSAEAQR